MTGSGIPRVLIVEDDEIVRRYLNRALEQGGFDPVAVRSGEDALAAVLAGGIDCVLIDGILPDMHGVRLANALLEDPAAAGVPFCFVTGAIRESSPLQHGVGALGKPVRLRELNGAVSSMIAWRDSGGSPVDSRREVLRRLETGFLVGP